MEGVFIKDYLGGTVSKFINNIIERRVGFKSHLSVKSIDFKVEDTYVKADISVTMSKADFDKLIEEVTK